MIFNLVQYLYICHVSVESWDRERELPPIHGWPSCSPLTPLCQHPHALDCQEGSKDHIGKPADRHGLPLCSPKHSASSSVRQDYRGSLLVQVGIKLLYWIYNILLARMLSLSPWWTASSLLVLSPTDVSTPVESPGFRLLIRGRFFTSGLRAESLDWVSASPHSASSTATSHSCTWNVLEGKKISILSTKILGFVCCGFFLFTTHSICFLSLHFSATFSLFLLATCTFTYSGKNMIQKLRA